MPVLLLAHAAPAPVYPYRIHGAAAGVLCVVVLFCLVVCSPTSLTHVTIDTTCTTMSMSRLTAAAGHPVVPAVFPHSLLLARGAVLYACRHDRDFLRIMRVCVCADVGVDVRLPVAAIHSLCARGPALLRSDSFVPVCCVIVVHRVAIIRSFAFEPNAYVTSHNRCYRCGSQVQ